MGLNGLFSMAMLNNQRVYAIAISNRIDLEGSTFETLILLSKFKVQVKMGRAVVDICLRQLSLVGQAC